MQKNFTVLLARSNTRASHDPLKDLIWKVMKISVIQMVLAFIFSGLTIANDLRAQEILSREVSLSMKEVTLRRALSQLEATTKVRFVYSRNRLKLDEKVSIEVKQKTLGEVLDELLAPHEIQYKVQDNNDYIVLTPGKKIKADVSRIDETDIVEEDLVAVTVTGKVTGADGAALPGVNVIVKGTTTGTTTDSNGNYTIEVPEGTVTLVFSFIGYATQEIVLDGRSTVDVVMSEDIQSLAEVVVVGYGTQEKKEVTGAITQVTGQDIIKSSAVSVSNSLAGRVPGMIVNQTNAEPGRDNARIFIRGRGTTGNTDALIVVDGIANRDGISRIDPNDIETITVLKDASAAIYGAQAANGVVLITTKRGKSGKPTINYSFNQGFVSPTRKVELADAALYARSVNLWSGQQRFTNDQIARYASGADPSTDWINEVYKSHSLQSRHSLTLSGGGESVKYFLSTGMASQDGLITGDETTEYKQYNFRSNIDAQVSKRLKLGLNLAGRREDGNWLQYNDNTVYGNTIRAAPVIPATIDGFPARGRENRNPLAIAKGPGYINLEKTVVNGTLTAAYQIPGVEGLSVDGFAAIDFFDGFLKNWQQRYTVYDPDDDGDGIPEPVKVGSDPSLRQDYQRAESVTLNAKLIYERTFGLHHINAFVAYEQNESKADTFYIKRTGFDSDKLDQIFAGNANKSSHENNGWAVETARQNYFGRIAYAFNDKYMAQFNFRYDGSYNFPSGNRFGFFPGVSVGWRISEESFLQNSPLVSNLKLRASWGKLGNDRVSPFQYLNLFSYGAINQGYVFNGGDVNVLNPGVAANPNITWETKSTLDIGVDAGFFQDRLTFEFDVFFEKRKDILAPRSVTVPYYTGLDLPDENIGEVDNKGFDAMVLYRSKVGDVTFNIGGNVTYARNKVIFVDEGDIYPESYQKLEGNPIGSQLAYDFIGIYRTQEDINAYPGLNGVAVLGDPIYRDVNQDGLVTNADRIRVDRTNVPEFQYGINLGAQYKGFDLSVLFQGQARASQYLRYTFNDGNNALEYFLENAWTVENTNASLPAYNRHNTNEFLSTLWLRDVSFLRLKNIELGYTIPKTIVSKAGIENLRVYVNGYNLLTFDKLKKDGLTDPESVDVEGWQFPHTKSINFGLNLTF